MENVSLFAARGSPRTNDEFSLLNPRPSQQVWSPRSCRSWLEVDELAEVEVGLTRRAGDSGRASARGSPELAFAAHHANWIQTTFGHEAGDQTDGLIES